MSRRYSYDVFTSHGIVAVEETEGTGIPVLFIHGNSFSRQVFRKQLDTPFAGWHRLVAFDLPGHGGSSPAAAPATTYSRPGLADAALELMEALGIDKAVLVGWSLGGHVAMEMLARSEKIAGLFLSGAPPVGRDVSAGFRRPPSGGSAPGEARAPFEAEAFVDGIFTGPEASHFYEIVRGTDPDFRTALFASLRKGAGIDQRQALIDTGVPTAIVNGAEDRIVNLDYFETVPYGNLWNGTCYRLEGAGHAPFWDAPERYNALLQEFLRTAAPPAG
ncbi:alpha/beta fold hydrolase [Ancylobacter oerskovii]|uniref:Alpha/beta fold hydrolase n=1 Tax=Ancylobacter oerskovii TaxID=459519 RepID=A0ABW4YWC3_9HYPH|nr:alpha/beta fold hydrolase [Ancylobacter oerskovii]MBS7544185.1 alpha/beta fold hydrolase [Ancylobacter oerskovii]